MATYVITGGAGFLGSHLCDYLVARGNKVICLDNLITGRTRNIEQLAGNDLFLFIKQDVTNYLFVEGEVDYVFHLASPASPVDYLKFPIQTLKVGALGTHKALGLAKAKGATFLLASTSEVYGDPLEHPQQENYWGNVNPVGPRGVYDEAKRYAEAMAVAYHRYHSLEARIARIFNTYGPRMRMNDGRVVPTFVRQVLSGNELTVFGDGTQTRSFCFVDDLVRGLVSLMHSNVADPVNIGNPVELSIREFAETVGKIAEVPVNLTYEPLPVDDPKVRQPDISRAKALLKWEPEVDLEDGLRRTIEWFRFDDRYLIPD